MANPTDEQVEAAAKRARAMWLDGEIVNGARDWEGISDEHKKTWRKVALAVLTEPPPDPFEVWYNGTTFRSVEITTMLRDAWDAGITYQKAQSRG